MSYGIPKYVVISNKLDELVNALPSEVRHSRDVMERHKELHTLIIAPAGSGRHVEAAGEKAAIYQNPRRETEVFLVDDREGNLYHLVGWSAFLAFFRLRESYARTLFSLGKGEIQRSKGATLYKVTRLGVPDDPAFLALPPPPWAPGTPEYAERERIASLQAAKPRSPTREALKPTAFSASQAPPPYLEQIQRQKRGR